MLWYIIAPIVMTIVILVFIKVFGSDSPPQQERSVETKKLSGKQYAQRIAIVLIICNIISKIAGIAEGDSKIYMIDIILESLFMYWFVVYIGYPIARWIAGKLEKQE